MRRIIISLIVLVGVTACNSNNKTETTVKDTKTHKETNENHPDEHEGVQLNNGEKWEVNREMRPHILDGIFFLNEYQANNDANYLQLAERLKEKNTSLIKSCTMKGEAHDELHKWLHPHMKLIEKLSLAENSEDASEIIQEIELSFQTFKAHFQ